MEATIQAEVSPKEYFDFILFTMNREEEIKKGLTFEKPVKTGLTKSEMCKVVITDYVYPKILEMDYRSSQGNNVIRYTILPKPNNCCQVTYRELKYDKNHVVKKLSGWQERSYLKKIEKRMKDVADYIIQQRNKQEDSQ